MGRLIEDIYTKTVDCYDENSPNLCFCSLSYFDFTSELEEYDISSEEYETLLTEMQVNGKIKIGSRVYMIRN